MSAGDGDPEWRSNRENEPVEDEAAVPSTSGDGSSEPVGFNTAALAENSAEIKASDNVNESAVLKFEDEEASLDDASGGALENQGTHSVSRQNGNSEENTDMRNGEHTSKKAEGASGDYNSILSEFDHFAAKGSTEAVGFGYEIGDMVWGKVKSHPWWPGHIYDEALASHSVQRSKREGHVLVAFYGDSSYGWFDSAELVPFEENFADKSRQTSSRAFVKAVEEAVDDLSRRRGLGLACCCRNEFNFGPSIKEGYFVVDVGDYEPGVFSSRQINKARDDFRPKTMLSYVRQLALTPMTDQHRAIDFIKNKATVLACRKALFEEFDETYAQAFGSVPVRPPRPTEPIAVDPSKAPLSGRQVFAETLSKGKHPIKPTKTKDQLEKDKYLFVRRDAPAHPTTKKTSSVQSGASPHLLPADGIESSELPTLSGTESHTYQDSGDRASVREGVKSIGGPKKSVEGGQPNVKVLKRKESSAENVNEKKKKKKKKRNAEAASTELNAMPANEKIKKMKEIRHEESSNVVQIPLANSDSGGVVEKVEKVSSDAVDPQKSAIDLPFLVRDLRTLALNPIHGLEKGCCSSSTLSAFLKFRSLVYRKSLVVSQPRTENEKIEAQAHLTAHQPALRRSIDKTSDNNKPTRPPSRPIDDPTKGGKKRDPSDRPATTKKQILAKRTKIANSEDIDKKIKKRIIATDDSKSVPLRPITTTPIARNFPPKKVESRKSPTMLVMKFPPGSALPSGPQLRAKFARFGPLDLDATRIFWKTYTCRLVYRRRADAEEALDFAMASENLFGSTNVRCHVKEVGVELPVEPELPPVRAKIPATVAEPPPPPSMQQPKSILKKASGDEGNTGNGRGTRVKFVLGSNSIANANASANKAQEQLSSFAVGSSSNKNISLSSMDISTTSSAAKNLPKVFSNVTTRQFEKLPMNLPSSEPNRDISQQLLDLMARCSDVVSHVSGVLGYMPYHAL
ncbi:Tudor/PWWP/MBT superfamily protein [Striga asiatica]|uniref:Tudor/PWWP/MBT superfamily protein n=1 Tax=Striga asiatica TaxID=4170 RepID=A0A5A7RKR9_STRAF|nr:Tudor/PWWP/MBT superfamily protein [Striga asiatica]